MTDSELKTKYKYIHFERIESKANLKTSKWTVRNNRTNDKLGEVGWYCAWRQYCFYATDPAVYSVGCLNDIADFIHQLSR